MSKGLEHIFALCSVHITITFDIYQDDKTENNGLHNVAYPAMVYSYNVLGTEII